ncbi:Alcohol dehydrogenase%2C propanol-preferring [Klebsiella oxytoca]|nr:Alcohol dehydrogenase%2C propanol-preferring [Klebsiella oxytoca]CAH5825255.1 Alcohol dehydrogenase%2C propanol-preferring [Klebsiella oxytoca]
MKAAVVTQDHQVNVTEKTLRPLQHGEALLKMDCCGVCHTDLYYKDFPGMSKPVFMVSVCSSVKIKGRDCGTINGHDESSSIRALMKDAREVLVR